MPWTLLTVTAIAAVPTPDASAREGVADAAVEEIEEIEVTSDVDDAPNAVTLDRQALLALPGRSADDVLRAVPGIQVSAHGGRGKAYQYLLRGVDAVHGSDVAVTVEGVPLNEPNNVHGHGYLDLHLVPRLLLRGAHLRLGTSDASFGDFATAASAELSLGLDDEGLLVTVGAGTDRSGLVQLAWRPKGAPAGNFVVASVDLGAGVGARRGWRQAQTAWGAEVRRGDVVGRLTVLVDDSAFQSAGVLREDDVADGAVGFWGARAPDSGGRSTRGMAIGSLGWGGARVGLRATAWAGVRHLELVQDYTGWWQDATYGDRVGQRHDAREGGARARVDASLVPGRLDLHGGADLRVNDATQSEVHLDADGAPWSVHTDADARYVGVGAWLSADVRPVRWWLLRPALRVEGLTQAWRARVEDGVADPDATWRQSAAAVPAPKILTSLRLDDRLEVVAAWGRGLRSPEARGVVDATRLPVTRVDTAELGVTARPHPAVELAADAFSTGVSEEIVFDHVQARFLSTGATRRLGGEAHVALRPVDTVLVRGEVSFADGRYLGTGDPIPYAPRWMGAVAVYLLDHPVGPVTLTAGLRARFVGPRPLPAGFRAMTAVTGDLTVRVQRPSWFVDVDLDNAFFNRWRDGQYVFASWWDRDTPRSDLPVAHFTAGDPTALRLSAGWRF